MLDLDADPNELNNDGETPLYWLAGQAYGNASNDLIRLLAKRGADVNFGRGSDKSTPLHMAAAHGNSSFVVALLKHGAEVNSTDHNGTTPLYWLADSPEDVGTSYLVATAKQLLDHGADINAGSYHTTPFVRTLWSCNHIELAELMLRRGADIRQRRGKEGRLQSTALHHVADEKECGTKLASSLLSMGLDVNVQDDDGRTPLFEAASEHYLRMVKFLVGRGADPTITGVAQFPYMKTIPYTGYKHPRVTPLENARRARKYWREEGQPGIAADYDDIIALLSSIES